MSDGASHCAGAQPQLAFSPEESSTQERENSARGGRWPCAQALLFGGLSLFVGDVSATQPTISPTVGQIKVKMAITRAHQLHRSAQPALVFTVTNIDRLGGVSEYLINFRLGGSRGVPKNSAATEFLKHWPRKRVVPRSSY
jgi:hypothetical protein